MQPSLYPAAESDSWAVSHKLLPHAPECDYSSEMGPRISSIADPGRVSAFFSVPVYTELRPFLLFCVFLLLHCASLKTSSMSAQHVEPSESRYQEGAQHKSRQ